MKYLCTLINYFNNYYFNAEKLQVSLLFNVYCLLHFQQKQCSEN